MQGHAKRNRLPISCHSAPYEASKAGDQAAAGGFRHVHMHMRRGFESLSFLGGIL
jgi:hypothetical protein